MPPRYAYWTILIDQKPTAFRAQLREELLPTLAQLRRKNPDVVMKWFARGRLWDSVEQERDYWKERKKSAGRNDRRQEHGEDKRGRDWRPGGEHKDPRSRFKKDKRGKQHAAGDRPWTKGGGPPRGDRPWTAGSKPPGARPPQGDRPWRDKRAASPPRGDRPWTTGGKPPGARPPQGDRPWRDKPAGPPRGDRPWTTGSKPPGARPPQGDRPWRDKPGTSTPLGAGPEPPRDLPAERRDARPRPSTDAAPTAPPEREQFRPKNKPPERG